jgi:hypothetical protein
MDMLKVMNKEELKEEIFNYKIYITGLLSFIYQKEQKNPEDYFNLPQRTYSSEEEEIKDLELILNRERIIVNALLNFIHNKVQNSREEKWVAYKLAFDERYAEDFNEFTR